MMQFDSYMRVRIGCMSIEYLLHLKHGCQGERFIVLSVSFKADPFLADEEKPAKLSHID